ncbi:unnamed protein product [Gongylonema pulchrum]|uniref:DUF4817 domain-containing protein n=1 Tax=Gongylonema pulchrum TaxID=637853 RepID=A0A183D6H2_9BILA|nr:unnamed protein product [Gongylonema pulchrum]
MSENYGNHSETEHFTHLAYESGAPESTIAPDDSANSNSRTSNHFNNLPSSNASTCCRYFRTQFNRKFAGKRTNKYFVDILSASKPAVVAAAAVVVDANVDTVFVEDDGSGAESDGGGEDENCGNNDDDENDDNDNRNEDVNVGGSTMSFDQTAALLKTRMHSAAESEFANCMRLHFRQPDFISELLLLRSQLILYSRSIAPAESARNCGILAEYPKKTEQKFAEDASESVEQRP